MGHNTTANTHAIVEMLPTFHNKNGLYISLSKNTYFYGLTPIVFSFMLSVKKKCGKGVLGGINGKTIFTDGQ